MTQSRRGSRGNWYRYPPAGDGKSWY